MALSISIKKNVPGFNGEVVASNAYTKITNLTGCKEGMSINVQSFAGDSLVQSKSFNFVPSLEGKNFIAQGYDYLKTLPEFIGAKDC